MTSDIEEEEDESDEEDEEEENVEDEVEARDGEDEEATKGTNAAKAWVYSEKHMIVHVTVTHNNKRQESLRCMQ